jgi:hypothetical protein
MPRHARPELDGWRAMRARSDDGAFESDERVRVAGPVVDFSERGARVLADRYWLEVSRASRGVVRRRDTSRGLELRLLGRGPCLLSFGPAMSTSDADEVGCRYPIAGGLLTRRAGGELSLSQTGSQPAELRAAVRAFVPRWSGPWYERVQLRFHVAIGRRYVKRLIAEAS